METQQFKANSVLDTIMIFCFQLSLRKLKKIPIGVKHVQCIGYDWDKLDNIYFQAIIDICLCLHML